MDLNLPSILTDAEVATYAATIAALVGILQTVSIVPIPDGSKARAIAVAILAALFVGLHAPLTGHEPQQLVVAILLSYAALASAALGINRAGSFTVQKVQARADQPPVHDYQPPTPQDGAQG